ncbi:hypothetical protein INT47_001425 [Mucor saturninus]|uniref:Uncharacterized protein n=1 Tax=Mucor saturninus TaxID=64648 RepID=A0A8H7V0V7_9FUNG|nr:hypothetical protein INT47_001425 [Mucor saturninus]
MPEFVISKADITTGDMLKLVDTCRNTTVGPNKYQLFCQTLANLDGSCKLLPSYLTSSGKLNCIDVVSQSYLQDLYDTTGMSCAVNCYYPLGTLAPPVIDFPSFTYNYPTPTYSYSYNYKTPTYSTSVSNATTTPQSFSSGTIQSSIGATKVTSAPGSTDSGSIAMEPNFIMSFLSVLTILFFVVRQAI